MWLWIAAAQAAAPRAMVAQGEQQIDFDVVALEASLNRNEVIAVTDATVDRLVGEGRQIVLESGGILAADVAQNGSVALAHAGGVTIHNRAGREILRLGGYGGAVRDVAISADATLLAVASTNGVILHRAADGKRLWNYKNEVFAVTFNPDASRVIASIESGNLLLRSYGGRVVGGFDQDPAIWFDWTPTALYTRVDGRSPQAWDPKTYAPLDTLPPPGGAADAAAHPSGDWLIVDGCVMGSDLCIGAGVAHSAFSSDGTLWVAGGARVRKWVEAPTDSVETPFSVPAGQTVTALAATPSGDWVIATSEGTLSRVAPDGTPAFEVRIPECATPCRPVGLGATSNEVWVASTTGAVMRYDDQGQPKTSGPVKSKAIAVGRMTQDEWVTVDRKGRTRVGDRPGKGKPTYPIVTPTGFGAGSRGYVVAGMDKVHPFKADGTPRPSPRLGPGRKPVALAVDPFGLGVAVVDDEGTLHCFSADGRPLFRRPLDLESGKVPPLVWSDNGQYIYVGGAPLTVLDAKDGSLVTQLVIAPRGEPSVVAGNPKGYFGAVLGEVSQLLRAIRIYDPNPPAPTTDDEPG